MLRSPSDERSWFKQGMTSDSALGFIVLWYLAFAKRCLFENAFLLFKGVHIIHHKPGQKR